MTDLSPMRALCCDDTGTEYASPIPSCYAHHHKTQLPDAGYTDVRLQRFDGKEWTDDGE